MTLILYKLKGDNIPEEEKEGIKINAATSDEMQTILVDKDVITIGRGTDVDIMTTSKKVSRTHCTLIKRNKQWFIVDHNSTSGTYVSRHQGKGKEEYTVQLISGEFPLRSGDEISLGGLIEHKMILVFTFGG